MKVNRVGRPSKVKVLAPPTGTYSFFGKHVTSSGRPSGRLASAATPLTPAMPAGPVAYVSGLVEE